MARCLLWLLAVVFGWIVGCRNRWFDWGLRKSQRVSVPVISVGNLTTGGTGKTPMVEFIARYLREKEIRVTLISRGYGSQPGKPNDEALELERKLPNVPHLQNPDRVAAARLAIDELEAELILLDDGFQHRRIHRDLDIVLIDATCPFGYGYLLPRGLLREPPANLLRGDMMVVTRVDQVEPEAVVAIDQEIRKHNAQAPIVHFGHAVDGLDRYNGDRQPLDVLHQKRVLAFCGIGNPSVFHNMLLQQGFDVVCFEVFPDHFDFQRSDIQRLVELAQQHQVDAVVCTHKDLVKIQVQSLGAFELWALAVSLEPRAGVEDLQLALDSVIDTVLKEE